MSKKTTAPVRSQQIVRATVTTTRPMTDQELSLLATMVDITVKAFDDGLVESCDIRVARGSVPS